MQAVSLTHPVLDSFLYLGSVSYTSRAGFFFIGGISLTYPVLASFLCGEFPLHIPCWPHFYLGSFSYTSCTGIISIWGVSLTHPVLVSVFIRGISLSHPLQASFFWYWEFLLHIPCCLYFSVGSFPYTSRTAFFFLWIWGVSLTHPVLALILWTDFLLEIRCCLIFIGGVSLTHPVLASLLFREFLLHIPCWLHFYLESFSYTSRVGFNFINALSLRDPMLAYFFIGGEAPPIKNKPAHPVLA